MDIQKAYDAPANMNGVWQPTYGGGRLFNPKSQDVRIQSSLSLYLDTPMDFGPGLRQFHAVGGLRANMVWRIQSGRPRWYTPPGKQPELRHRPIRTWTDLQVEKTLVEAEHRKRRSLRGGVQPVQPAGQPGWRLLSRTTSAGD